MKSLDNDVWDEVRALPLRCCIRSSACTTMRPSVVDDDLALRVTAGAETFREASVLEAGDTLLLGCEKGQMDANS